MSSVSGVLEPPWREGRKDRRPGQGRRLSACGGASSAWFGASAARRKPRLRRAPFSRTSAAPLRPPRIIGQNVDPHRAPASPGALSTNSRADPDGTRGRVAGPSDRTPAHRASRPSSWRTVVSTVSDPTSSHLSANSRSDPSPGSGRVAAYVRPRRGLSHRTSAHRVPPPSSCRTAVSAVSEIDPVSPDHISYRTRAVPCTVSRLAELWCMVPRVSVRFHPSSLILPRRRPTKPALHP